MKPAPLAQRVSTLELFFDLVFVFTITQLTAVLRVEPTPLVALQVLLMLAIIFWMYGGYVWLTNAVSADRASRRLVLLAGMAGFFIVALTVPNAFDGGGLAFGLAYAVVIAVHIGLFSRASRVRSILGVLRLGRFNALIAVAVIVGGAVGGVIQLAVWSVVVLLAWLVVPRISPGSFDIGAAHFVERHGLVVIVAIGESVVALGLGLRDLPVGPGLIAVALLGLALSACLWWAYFGGDDQRAEEALMAAPPARRSMLAIQSYGYAHLALLLGIIAIAAAVEEIAHHPADVLDIGLAVALGAGGALYLGGQAGFRRVLTIGTPIPRLLAAVVCLATVPLGSALAAAAQLGALLAIFLALFALESLRARSRERIQEGRSEPRLSRGAG
ncbi:MAG: low temperature requirement protein A [Geodermatophilaceae bacterium]|nr:low temperature requirement protein A [Geodermatophilaceae bacterium]